MAVKGIDVSNNNGHIDWRRVAQAGYRFALIKATESMDFRDPTFERNATVAKHRGLITGAYHFARPTRGDAVAQAKFYLSELAKAPTVDMPPIKMLDEEDAGKLDNAQLVTWCRNFGMTIRGAHGDKPLLYASSSFIREHGLAALADFFDLFVADYTTASAPDLGGWPHTWTFWQHTSSGIIPGHSGAFDLNLFNGSLQDLRNFITGTKGVKEVANTIEKQGTVSVNGDSFPGAVVSGSWYVEYTALLSLPGATLTRGANDEVEITVPTTHTASSTPAGLQMVSNAGFHYPSFIVPSSEGGTGTRDLILATQVMQALGYPDAAIINAMVAFWQYSEAMATQAAQQGYPVLQQTQYTGRVPQSVRISTGTDQQNLQVQNVTATSKQPIANVDITFTDKSSVQFP